jgi:hypothetical protein
MKINHLQKILMVVAVTGVVLCASTVVGKGSSAVNTAQPVVVSTNTLLLFVAGQTDAQLQTDVTADFKTITVEKPKLLWLSPYTTVNAKENRESVEGLDPRAWTTVVCWHPGTSAFPTAETHRSKLGLFWTF